MSQPVQAESTLAISSTRAQVFSAVRVLLHTAVIVALVLLTLGVSQFVAVAVGLLCGLVPASHSRRIAVVFDEHGVTVTNFFKQYRIDDLTGKVAHFYLRNRVEFELADDARFHVQAGTFWNETQVNAFIDAVEARGGQIKSVASS